MGYTSYRKDRVGWELWVILYICFTQEMVLDAHDKVVLWFTLIKNKKIWLNKRWRSMRLGFGNWSENIGMLSRHVWFYLWSMLGAQNFAFSVCYVMFGIASLRNDRMVDFWDGTGDWSNWSPCFRRFFHDGDLVLFMLFSVYAIYIGDCRGLR